MGVGKNDKMIEKLLAKTDDFDLCDGVFCALTDITDRMDCAATESDPVWTVVLVWGSAGLIENGGFCWLFESASREDPGFLITAVAYKTIDLPEAFAAFQAAFGLFSDHRLPADREKLFRIYLSHPEEVREAVDRQFFEINDDIPRYLAKFIRSHAEVIRKYLSAAGWDGPRGTNR